MALWPAQLHLTLRKLLKWGDGTNVEGVAYAGQFTCAASPVVTDLSGGVLSVTQLATGNYRITLDSAVSTGASVILTAEHTTPTTYAWFCQFDTGTTSTIDVFCWRVTIASGVTELEDPTKVHFLVIGY